MSDIDTSLQGQIDTGAQETTPSTTEQIFGSGSGTEQHQQTQQQGVGQQEEPGQQPQQTQQQQVAPQYTPEQIAQIAAQTALQTQQQQQAAVQQEQQPQLTREQLNMFEFNEDMFRQIFEGEDKGQAIAAFNTMAQGIAKQAFTMAQYQTQQLMEERFGQLDQRLQPHLNFAQQQQEAAMAQQFFSQYPDLNGMDQVVNQVTAGLRQEGAQFQTNEQLFAEVARRTQATIQHISGGRQAPGVQGQGQTPQQVQQTQQTPQKPGMASVGAGGTGGAGGGQGGNQAKTNAAKAIFG